MNSNCKSSGSIGIEALLKLGSKASGDVAARATLRAGKPREQHQQEASTNGLNEAEEVLIDQRLNKGLLGGLREFPGGQQEQGEVIIYTIAHELREEWAIEVAVGEKLIAIDHAYSHKKLRFVVHLCQWVSGNHSHWQVSRFVGASGGFS